jgi:hypothetical protein
MRFPLPFVYPVLFLAIATMAVLSGFRFSAGDIDTYLPFILNAHDPTLFKNDLLLGTMNSHPVYIWRFLAIFLNWIPVGLLIRVVFILQTIVITSGASLFYRQFFGKNPGWIFFLLLLIVPVSAPGFGRYGLNPYSYFHAGAFAFGLTLLSYSLVDRGRWLIGGSLTGAIFLIHPITAIYAAEFLFIRGLLDFPTSTQRPRMISGLLILVIIALPSLIPAIQTFLTPSGNPIDTHFWRAIALLRMNHGYFISAWVPERFIQLAGCFTLLLTIFRKHPAFRRIVPILIVVAGGLLLMTLADLFTIRFFLRLQLGRCSYFLFFIVTAFAVDTLTNRQFRGRDRPALTAWTIAAVAILIVYGNAALSNQHGWIRVALIMLIAVCIVIICCRLFFRAHPHILTVAICAMILAATAARATTSFFWTHAQEISDPWISFCVRCSSLIPKDSVVMIPLTRQDFRPYALRATWCTWKDCAPHLFCDKTLPEWWRRAQQFGVTLKTNKGDLPKLYNENAIAIARAERIRYVVFDKTQAAATALLLFENEAFGLIDLAGWRPTDSLTVR